MASSSCAWGSALASLVAPRCPAATSPSRGRATPPRSSAAAHRLAPPRHEASEWARRCGRSAATLWAFPLGPLTHPSSWVTRILPAAVACQLGPESTWEAWSPTRLITSAGHHSLPIQKFRASARWLKTEHQASMPISPVTVGTPWRNSIVLLMFRSILLDMFILLQCAAPHFCQVAQWIRSKLQNLHSPAFCRHDISSQAFSKPMTSLPRAESLDRTLHKPSIRVQAALQRAGGPEPLEHSSPWQSQPWQSAGSRPGAHRGDLHARPWCSPPLAAAARHSAGPCEPTETSSEAAPLDRIFIRSHHIITWPLNLIQS